MKRNTYTIKHTAPPIVCGVQNICKALGLEYECTGKNIEVMATLEELHIINTWIDKRTLYKGVH